MRKFNKDEIKILCKGVDSLYMFLDCSDIFMMDSIIERVVRCDYEQSLKLFNVEFIRVKQYLKTYPNCIKAGQFLFFLNRRSMFIKVLSLEFELRGYEGAILELCEILERMTGNNKLNWCDLLKASRIDCYCDFAYEKDFAFNQFRSRLKKRGIFKNAKDANSVTYYFGNRSVFMVRLYVKSSEINHSGKDYLKEQWKKFDCQDEKIWRLEFEIRKDKILELCKFREISCIDKNAINSMFAYGVNALEYVKGSSINGNMSKQKLHPIWEQLKQVFDGEYSVTRKQVKTADINYRRKRARKTVISWLAARELSFDDIPDLYRNELSINQYDYEKSLNRVKVDYRRVKE